MRDALLGRVTNDLDFTTDARPDEILRSSSRSARRSGTSGGTSARSAPQVARRAGRDHDVPRRQLRRAHAQADVAFGDTLEGDLARRDFTVNSMALRVPDAVARRSDRRCRGPRSRGCCALPPTRAVSFGDDPLRMLRAARFAAQLGFEVESGTAAAMADAARDPLDREPRADPGRARAAAADGRPGARHPAARRDGPHGRSSFRRSAALQLEIDEHHHHKDVYEHSLTVLRQAIALERSRHPDAAARRAAATRGPPARHRQALDPPARARRRCHLPPPRRRGARLARKRLQELRFDTDTTTVVTRLIELHLRFFGYAEGAWTDSAVRRYVRDAGAELERLHILTRADVTTRNRRKAGRLARAYDDIERRIDELAEQEELDAMRPELDGNRIQEVLGIGPGREVGEAYRFLLDVRLDEGHRRRGRGRAPSARVVGRPRLSGIREERLDAWCGARRWVAVWLRNVHRIAEWTIAVQDSRRVVPTWRDQSLPQQR